MMKGQGVFSMVALMLMLSASAYAHHAQAPFFDQERWVEIEGVVTRFDFRNPHPILYVDVAEENGEVVEWQIQFANATNLRRRGWTKDSVLPGETVRARGHPSRNPETRGMQGARVTRQDGTVLGAPIQD